MYAEKYFSAQVKIEKTKQYEIFFSMFVSIGENVRNRRQNLEDDGEV